MKKYLFLLLILCLIPSLIYGAGINISALPDGGSTVDKASVMVGNIGSRTGTTSRFTIAELFGLYFGTLTGGKFCTYNSSSGKVNCTSSGYFDQTGNYSLTGTWDFTGATVTLPSSQTLTTPVLDTPTITLADASTLTLPSAAVDSGWTTGLLGFGPDGTGIFVNLSDLEATIPISGEITTEHVACWSVEGGSNLLKACGLKTTDNSTATHLLCKDDSGEIENCTLAGLAISGTTSPTITVEAMPANATVNAAGEMTIDTTTDQIRWYGTAQQQLSPKLTFSVVVPSVADTDDMLIMKAPYGMTITALDCIVSAATSATINIQECDSAGANCVDTATSDLACDTDGANTTTLNNAVIDSGDWLKLDVASISGTPGALTVTVTYTIVAD